MTFRLPSLAIVMALVLACAGPALSQGSRIKDIASLQSGRDNQLIGYGLVVGLQGTGDSLRSSPFTEQSMRAMLQNLGISTQGGQSAAKNVAAVMVTANLPPFASPGSRIDATVSSLGDSTSLRGGTLVMTSLSGADGQIYAVAQGSVVVSGFTAQGQAATVQEGVTTSGRVPNGAIIERELPSKFKDTANLVLQLRNPDFSTALGMAKRINAYSQTAFGTRIAEARDSQEVVVQKPGPADLTQLMADIENLIVETDTPAKVVINERTGTIVIGADVRVSKVAVSYGTLTVQVNETPQVVQPQAFSNGRTAVQPQTDIVASKDGGTVATLEGPDLRTLVSGLNSIGVKPDGIIAILQGIKSAGALQAELVLQ
ncbi:flagellar basal body P-ring protein FlgI [Rhizobium paknamense]|uniref:Flagellar P-ring protein n=1 Tax=Rhizobium paknamense TaxID=1206817 RepID=A0ABU0IFG0_9HYPH|nr:flagellar basal body P-ring protein FlgI [Rhizobium paknamense]MDQ0456988.1 flagellar P-ring protein precursor FlgI [Rhizobium paknamense]